MIFLWNNAKKKERNLNPMEIRYISNEIENQTEVLFFIHCVGQFLKKSPHFSLD